jgi:prephenate dehydrogenase
MRAADTVFDSVAGAADGADIAVVCVPILSTAALAIEAAEAMPKGAVITDVGSTKAFLEKEITGAIEHTGIHFVGSHPIAGSDMTGIESSCEDLYDGATVVITPGCAPDAAVEKVVDLWKALGAVPVVMAAEEHDRILAKTSHLPHLVSAALVRAVLADDPGMGCFCGSGFRDSTRIAAGSADVWHDIVKTNAAAVARELRGVGASITALAEEVERGELQAVRDFLEDCRRLRALWGKADSDA